MKQLYGISLFIASLAFFNWSMTASNASSSGPNISLGSNPIENFYGVQRMYPSNSITLVSSTAQDFVVTKFETSSVRCTLAIDGNTVFSHYSTALGLDYLSNSSTNFEGKLKVPTGSVLSLDATIVSGDIDCAYYVEGYYTQP